MSDKTWGDMTDRERDAWIAENVMGFVRWYGMEDDGYGGDQPYALLCTPDYAANWSEKFKNCTPNGAEPILTGVPYYTIDPAADYAVLSHVRETWLFSKRRLFGGFLSATLAERAFGNHREVVEAIPDRFIRYEPGDYSHAAYLALTEQEKTND